VLTCPLARAEADGKPPPAWRSFAARRALRILPPFYVACGVWLLMPRLAFGLPIQVSPWVVISHLTLTYSFFPGLVNELSPAGYWFIAALAHLYLVFPLLAFAARRHLWAFAGAALGVSLVTRAWSYAPASPLAANPAAADVLQASAWGHLVEFAAGMVAGRLAARWLAQGRRFASGQALAALGLAACIGYAYLAFPARGGGRIFTYPAAGVLYGAVVLVMVTQQGFAARLLSWRALRALGTIAYSMYLYNFLAFVLFSGRLSSLSSQSAGYWALALLAVLAAGVVSFAVTEWPLTRLRARLRR
jgi:peptidoglycan/LPS O-acetylase OafA/YrhL